MIEKIEIKNFKSVADLSFELGRVNVLIGANGTGKSNILEAIAFGGAAAADKLDNEFLSSRGIRVADHKLMKSSFPGDFQNDSIEIVVRNTSKEIFRAILNNPNFQYPKWQNYYLDRTTGVRSSIIDEIDKYPEKFRAEGFKSLFGDEDIESIITLLSYAETKEEKKQVKNFLLHVFQTQLLGAWKTHPVANYYVFSPENSSIRNFEREGQIQPLGINGEGLFKLLKVLAETQSEKLQKINEKLRLIEWFDGFEMPTKLIADQAYLKIKDRYLDETLQNFDQRSSNEGFLFLLFYFTLFIADETPKFFAVDNIDAALNPKLAAKLMQELVVLSKEHDKQVILTTHNPALLDGLDLDDDEVRLFVVYRSVEGHTTLKRVTRQKPRPGKEQVPLSEAFLRGYIGGLPSNF